MDLDATVTTLPAAAVTDSGGGRHRLPRALQTVRRRWWGGAAAVATIIGSLVAPVTASGPLAAAPSEGLQCSPAASPSPSPSYVLNAKDGYISTPDGNSLYMWGYSPGNGSFQYPGPNLCVTEGDTVTVTLRNSLNVPTSIVFNGIVNVMADGARANPDPSTGSLTKAAAANGSVTYQFKVPHAGTYLYESGTNPTLQDQMGLIGALVVRPALHPDYAYNDQGTTVPSVGATTYTATTAMDPAATWMTDQWRGHTVIAGGAIATVKSNNATTLTLDDSINTTPGSGWSSGAGVITTTPAAGTPFTILALDTRFNPAPGTTTLPHEYMHLLSEIDPDLHHAIELGATSYDMSKYKARYYMINGRSFPDTIAPNNAQHLPTQPYGALVHVLPRAAANPLPSVIRYLNAGPVSYPFHPHSNHEKVIGIDGHELVNQVGAPGGQPGDISQDRYGVTVAPGQTMEAMFSWIDAQQWSGGGTDTAPNPIGVPIPDQINRFEGPYWNGSPYLGDREPLADGVVRYNQCGEFYHVAHSHALFQVTNYGFSGGGMLTMVRVDPPKSMATKKSTDAGTPRDDCTVPSGH